MAQEPARIELTADVVAAHVSNNKVAIGDVATLVANVHAALATLGAPAAPAEPEKKAPAVSVRSSIKPDSITCLECGSKQKMLKRHLQTAHQLTPAEYRSRFDLPVSYPMISPNYAQQRSELAMRIGLRSSGRFSKAAPRPADEGETGAGITAAPSEPPKPRASRGKSSVDVAASADQPKRRSSAAKPATAPQDTASETPKRKRARAPRA